MASDNGNALHEFFVVNIQTEALSGTVSWESGTDSASIDVNGLKPTCSSELKAIRPTSDPDQWSWSERGRKYTLNIKQSADRYAVVVISDYGIAVLPTSTSPDHWEW
ncbi:hypothetical protein [Kitasatospora sp. CB01950]|uniref:hypothetical protein n=1 Tax=Kitasatospora sp. CB01950 TaxID=1703930 RepID=UPI0009F9A5F7|nr:hypothetical protein [Kitasatospora sp. CB01950]